VSTSSGQRERDHSVRRVGLVSLSVNSLLVLLKGAAGVIYGSRALTADAVHSLSDLSTDLAIVIGSRFWSRPADDTHPMGHSGIETAVAMFTGLMLITAGAGIGYDSLRSLGEAGNAVAPGPAAIAAAVVSVVFKEILYRWTIRKSRETRSAALAANAKHNRSDALSSIPVLVALAMSALSPDLAFIDGVAGAVVSVFVVISGIGVLKPCVAQLVNTSPSLELVERIRDAALATDGVTSVHRLRARMQAGGVFVDLHVQVEGKIQIERAFLTGKKVEEAILALDPSIMDVMARVEPWAPCGDADRCYHGI